MWGLQPGCHEIQYQSSMKDRQKIKDKVKMIKITQDMDECQGGTWCGASRRALPGASPDGGLQPAILVPPSTQLATSETMAELYETHCHHILYS